MKTYHATHPDHPVKVAHELGGYTLGLHTHIANHSPTGFNWGYAGSGPAQLALALLADHFGDTPEGDERAARLHQAFKFAVVAHWPQTMPWTLTSQDIEAAVQKLEARETETEGAA